MKAWITKYALTDGIEEMDGEINHIMGSEYFYVKGYRDGFTKKEYFPNKIDAICNAEERRIKKIKSLEKQIKKLQDMKFE